MGLSLVRGERLFVWYWFFIKYIFVFVKFISRIFRVLVCSCVRRMV